MMSHCKISDNATFLKKSQAIEGSLIFSGYGYKKKLEALQFFKLYQLK